MEEGAKEALEARDCTVPPASRPVPPPLDTDTAFLFRIHVLV